MLPYARVYFDLMHKSHIDNIKAVLDADPALSSKIEVILYNTEHVPTPKMLYLKGLTKPGEPIEGL